MNVLVLDDSEERHRVFKRNLVGKVVTHVYSYDEAVAALKDKKFDAVYLDHDLDDSHYVDFLTGTSTSSVPDGEDVAKFIAGQPKELQPNIAFIHSMNTVAVPRMARLLQDAGIYTVIRMFGSKSGTELDD